MADAHHGGEGRSHRGSGVKMSHMSSYWEGGDDSSDGWPSWKAHSSDSSNERDNAFPSVTKLPSQRRHDRKSTQASVNADELFSQPSDPETDGAREKRHSMRSTHSVRSRHVGHRSHAVHQPAE